MLCWAGVLLYDRREICWETRIWQWQSWCHTLSHKKKWKENVFLGVTPAHTALNGKPRSSNWSNLESMEYAGYTAATKSNNTPTQQLRKKTQDASAEIPRNRTPHGYHQTEVSATILIRGPVGEALFTESWTLLLVIKSLLSEVHVSADFTSMKSANIHWFIVIYEASTYDQWVRPSQVLTQRHT